MDDFIRFIGIVDDGQVAEFICRPGYHYIVQFDLLGGTTTSTTVHYSTIRFDRKSLLTRIDNLEERGWNASEERHALAELDAVLREQVNG